MLLASRYALQLLALLAHTSHGQWNDTSFNDSLSSFSTSSVVSTPTVTEEPTTTAVTQVCANNSDCSVSCSSASACRNHIIICPTGFEYKCSVSCTATYACQNALILASESLELSLACSSGQDACSDIQIESPFSLSLSTKLTIDTNHENAARNMYINATHTRTILIECYGVSSCQYMHLYATYANRVEVDGGLRHSLNGMVLDATYVSSKFYLECSSVNSCNEQFVFLNHSTANNVEFQCQSIENGCDGAQWFLTAHSGTAKFTCKSCIGTYIDMSEKQGDLTISCEDNGCARAQFFLSEALGDSANSSSSPYTAKVRCRSRRACQGTRIYSPQGFRYDTDSQGLELVCDKAEEYCNNITIFCGGSGSGGSSDNWQYSCNTEYDASYAALDGGDGIICEANDAQSYGTCGQTLFPTASPTKTTLTPSLIPTSPSSAPSRAPTNEPVTRSPTSPTRPPQVVGADESSGNGGGNRAENVWDDWGTYVGVFVGVAVFAAILVTVLCLLLGRAESRKKEETQRKREEKEIRAIEKFEQQVEQMEGMGSVGNAGNAGNAGSGDIEMQVTGAGTNGMDGSDGDDRQTGADVGNDANGATGGLQVRKESLGGNYSVSPAVRAHQIKKERKALGLDDDDDQVLAQQDNNGKDGYGLLMDKEEIADAFDEL